MGLLTILDPSAAMAKDFASSYRLSAPLSLEDILPPTNEVGISDTLHRAPSLPAAFRQDTFRCVHVLFDPARKSLMCQTLHDTPNHDNLLIDLFTICCKCFSSANIIPLHGTHNRSKLTARNLSPPTPPLKRRLQAAVDLVKERVDES